MGKSISAIRFAARAMVSLVVAAVAFAPIAGAQSVREVPTSNRVAGTGISGWNGDFQTAASSTELSGPSYTVFDSHGNQYISDTGNNCIRRIDASNGSISVVAGYEATPSSADTCAAAGLTILPTQGLMAPAGLAFDTGGDLFIADSGHNCVRELPNAASGVTGTNQLLSVVDTCTNSTALSVSPVPTGILVEGSGDLGVAIADQADGISQVIEHLKTSPATAVCIVAGQPSALVSSYCPGISGGNVALNLPNGLAVDPVGNYFLADTGNSCIRELSTTGVVSTYLGQCASDATGTPTPIANFSPNGLVFGPEGYLYISNGDDTVLQYRGGTNTFSIFAGIPYTASQTPPPYSGIQEGIAAVDVSLNKPLGLSVDSTGNVYVADVNNSIVRQLAMGTQFPAAVLHNSGTPQTLHFEIDAPVNLTVTTATDFPIFSGNNTCNGVLKPATAGNPPVTCSVTLAFTPTAPGLRRSPLTLSDTTTTPSTVYHFGTSGIGLGANALFTPGNIQTQAGGLSSPAAVAVSSTGDAYFAEQSATAGGGDIKILPAGSGAVTVLVPAGGQLTSPSGLALDASQNLYVADSAASSIFEVNASGTVSTVASGLNDPVAVAVDAYGNLLVEQNGSGAVELLRIFAGGQQVIMAGQGTNPAANNVPATTAQFSKLSGLYLDTIGNLYISDAGALRVYNIDTTGIIHFFAGNGTTTSTNPTIPTQTALLGPAGLTGDAAGDVFIAEGGGNRIDVVFAGTNQNPGIAQLAGTGTAGSSGDNGPANLAELNDPVSLGLDATDDLFLIDAGNSSLREIGYINPTLAFGVVKVGQTGGPLSTTLWDAGNLPLTPLTSFTPVDSTDFHQVFDGCGGTLQQGSTCQLSFTFTPSATGSYSTTASANANAVDIPQVITLTASTPLPPTITAPNVNAVYGTAYTLSATVSGGQPTAPTGTVMFSIGGVAVCPVGPLPANDTATCSPSPTLENVGSYTVTVTYSGDNNYLPLTTTFTLTITPAPVTITADNKSRPINTPNPALTVTITGVVAGQSILPPTPCCTTTAVTTSPVGTYPIVPTQPATAGSGTLLSNYTITYVSGTLTITNSGAGSGTLTAPNVAAVYGMPYTLSAAVTGNQPTAPTGTVTFTLGGALLCPASNAPANATCSPSPTLENVGTYTVTVTYSGDSIYPAKATTLTLTITPAPVTISADNQSRGATQANPNPYTGTITGVVAGQSITDTYASPTAPPSGTGTPGTSFPILPGTATAGAGTLLTNYAITYVNGTLTITSNTGGSATLTAPPVTAVYGSTYLLAASVTGQTPAPTGTVSFSIGGTALCPASTTPAHATCSPSPTLENVGSYLVTVAYSGDSKYAATSTTLALTITPAPVTISADSFARATNAPNPVFTGIVSGVVAGQSIVDTYTSPTAPPSNQGPVGSYPILPGQPATAGSGTLLSNYSIVYAAGTLNVTASVPGSGTSTVNAPNVNVVYGMAYTLAATVTSAAAPAPTGTLVFFVNGAAICPAQTVPANGKVTCSPSPTLENAGTYPVTVTYSGDATYQSKAATFTLTIAPAPVTIIANSFTRPANTPNPTLTGTVSGVVAGQTITATYATTATESSPAGTYAIVPTAVAGTDTLLANYAITITNGTLTITEGAVVGSFSLKATPPEQEIDKEGGVNYTVALTSLNGFTDTVTLSCSGLPAGGTCSFAPSTISLSAGGTDVTLMNVAATADATNVPDGSFGRLQVVPLGPASHTPSTWLAWTMLPLGFGSGATTLLFGRRRRKRSSPRKWGRLFGWIIAVMPLALILLGLSGCASPVNYKIYTITVTATDTAHPSFVQSTTVQLTLAK
jgi:hypothetical protein